MLIYTPLSTGITVVLPVAPSFFFFLLLLFFSRLSHSQSSSGVNWRARLILIIPRCWTKFLDAKRPLWPSRSRETRNFTRSFSRSLIEISRLSFSTARIVRGIVDRRRGARRGDEDESVYDPARLERSDRHSAIRPTFTSLATLPFRYLLPLSSLVGGRAEF